MYWMELIIEGAAMEPKRVKPRYDEADEILLIIVRSRQTVVRSLTDNRKSQIANRKCK